MLEPILRAHAEQRGTTLRYATELIDFEQVALLTQERQPEQLEITVNTLIVNMGCRYQAGAVLPEADAALPLAHVLACS